MLGWGRDRLIRSNTDRFDRCDTLSPSSVSFLYILFTNMHLAGDKKLDESDVKTDSSVIKLSTVHQVTSTS